jgi:hypothetical protein
MIEIAYTAPTSPYPPFINIKERDDGTVRVFIRGEATALAPNGGLFSGTGAWIDLPRDQAIEIFGKAARLL